MSNITSNMVIRLNYDTMSTPHDIGAPSIKTKQKEIEMLYDEQKRMIMLYDGTKSFKKYCREIGITTDKIYREGIRFARENGIVVSKRSIERIINKSNTKHKASKHKKSYRQLCVDFMNSPLNKTDFCIENNLNLPYFSKISKGLKKISKNTTCKVVASKPTPKPENEHICKCSHISKNTIGVSIVITSGNVSVSMPETTPIETLKSILSI